MAEAFSNGPASAIADVPRVRALLIEAAAEGHAVSYSGLLGRLGLAFSRPKMRALCRTLDRIDADAVVADEPELAVLVVRAADGLPGQGWWTGHVAETGYAGAWVGPGAMDEVERLQRIAFRFWRDR
ncbi:ribose-phosphate pyrophosphokinase [Sphingomonas gellani]|uniref:ribose-phosphate pyrophosphokinase n=1 Tax=Sphingomonas gellani TaxID=1166340 RepID=UPI000AE9526F|nr:ribose-phosphate pyrophosphokinase [Sphingomonas gellani]